MATLFGGYCAEKLKFKEITTGASNDLKLSSELARRLVKEYGMSSLGPISFGEKEEYVFLGKEISEQRNYSEEVAAKIDKEVAHLIEISQKKAESILNQRKSLLEKIAKTLIEKETIEKEEFEKLISEKREKNTRALKKVPRVQALKIKEIK
jgi:cell division protease FtsH